MNILKQNLPLNEFWKPLNNFFYQTDKNYKPFYTNSKKKADY